MNVDARTWTHGNVGRCASTCMRACTTVDVPTALTHAAVRRRRTLHVLNYMLLTVVANGHNCVATALHGGVARILHWWLQKLSAEAFFLKKVDNLL